VRLWGGIATSPMVEPRRAVASYNAVERGQVQRQAALPAVALQERGSNVVAKCLA
jgi:hypothetical protein